MARGIKLIGQLIVGLAVAVLVFSVVARLSDGPIAIVAGGPFTSGEPYTGPEPDWSFVRDVREVEFQLLDPPRSRTTWIVEHEGRAYIPSGYMKTAVGRLWKQWPHEAMADGRILLRIDGRIYERQLVRVRADDGPHVLVLLQKLVDKYVGGAPPPDTMPVRDDEIWIFELAPRL